MPSKNVIKVYLADHYYHIYNRGVAKQPIFLNDHDKDHFIQILKRHLDPFNNDAKQSGEIYSKFDQEIELLSYCLMDNHFHLLVHLKEDTRGVSNFMRAVLTGYTMYFNKKYERVGTLFQGIFKASMITSDSYLLEITRYIHLNPENYMDYPYSSLGQYLRGLDNRWLISSKILDLFEGVDYQQFLEDGKDSAPDDNLSFE